MPKPHKKIKPYASQAEHLPHEIKKPKRATAPEDLVGNFLVGVSVAFLTALISLATTKQIDWAIVLGIFAVSLLVLIVYQKRS